MYLLARAVPAAVVALVITFSADHSVGVGWVSLIAFGAVTGAIILLASARMLGGLPRTLLLLQGGTLVVGAAVALVASVSAPASGVGVFTRIAAAVFIVSGAVELVAGLRSRGQVSVARDWIFLGAVSIAFGIAVAVIPVDYSQAVIAGGTVLPNLTASVVVVGALGAYAAIVAVYLVIAGLSLKWAKHPERTVSVEETA